MHAYRHVAITTREYHEGLMSWARRVLSDGGMETLEIYGQIPAKSLANAHLVFFPYRVGPEVKIQENAPGANLMHPRERPGEPSPFVPPVWAELGAAIAQGVEQTFGGPSAPEIRRHRGAAERSPYPALLALPKGLRAWYGAPPPSGDEPWVLPSDDGLLVRPPSLAWKQGIAAMTRYLIIAHEPGRGSEERTSAAPPMAVSALNVLMAAAQLERSVEVLTPPYALPAGLQSYVEALIEARAAAGDEAGAARLRLALEEVMAPVRAELGVILIQDLNNRELIQLMQALQRPLQSSLNLQVRYNVGSGPVFMPSAFVSPPQIRGPNAGLRPTQNGRA